MLKSTDRIYVAGHNGMAGSSICRALRAQGFYNIIARSHSEFDLTQQSAVLGFLEAERPNVIIIAAAKVGGIFANATYPAEFLYQNLAISQNIIHAAYKIGVDRLLFLGSSCIYPRAASQPILEEALLTDSLEPTNEAYAIAKIAGLKLCQYYSEQYGCAFHSVMPTNLYGPGDNYHPENSHVIPGLIRRFHEAKINNAPEVAIWGTGKPRREFMHVDDLANAIVYLLKTDFEKLPSWINVGSGSDLTIAELAQKIKLAVDYKGQIKFDPTRPDGTPRKFLDSTKIRALGWQPKINLEDGLATTYQHFKEYNGGHLVNR